MAVAKPKCLLLLQSNFKLRQDSMRLNKLSLVNFKSYLKADIEFSDRINCLTGDNGVGKTNLLDAIYYLSFCRSYFSLPDSALIRHNEDFLILQGWYSRLEDAEEIFCGIKRHHKKKFSRNGNDYKKLADHIGLLPLVMLSPGDSELVTGGSEERRKFVDSIISQYDRVYLENLIDYNRLLAQRNALLKDFAAKSHFDRTSLEIYDERMTIIGNQIFETRKEFLSQFIPLFQHLYAYISGQNEDARLVYESQLTQDSFSSLLRQHESKDRMLQYSTCGIHKDDLLFELNGYPLKKTGSQGQQKTFIIALRLAQFDFIKAAKGLKPLLMFDDLFDKLDGKRVEKILSLVAEDHFGQIFITDTNLQRLESILKNLISNQFVYSIEPEKVSKLK